MSHHLISAVADSVHNLGPFFGIGDFKFLLEENRGLLV